MSSLFTAIINMSITASYVALAVIAIRLLFKKVPKIFSYVLWLPVWIRLVIPFSFSSAVSFLKILKLRAQTSSGTMEYVPQNIGYMQKPAVDIGVDGINNAINTSLPNPTPFASVNPMQIFMEAASIVWIIGIAVLIIYSIFTYIRITDKLKTATLLKDNVFETDRITTPFVCGFIKPKVFIPVGINKNELDYILAHEKTHIARRDYLIKPLAFLVLVLHWFNPLIWISFALMIKDMEMSCDASVIKKLGDEIKVSYSNSLIALSIKRSGLSIGPLAFGESNIKSRIKNVLSYKKPKFWVVGAACIGIVVFMAVFISNPVNESKDKGRTELQISESASVASYMAISADFEAYMFSQQRQFLKIIPVKIEGKEYSETSEVRPYFVGTIEVEGERIDICSTKDKTAVFADIDAEKFYTAASPDPNKTKDVSGVIKYETSITISKDFRVIYGYTSNLRKKYGEGVYFKSDKELKVPQDEYVQYRKEAAKRVELYIAVMKEAFEVENGGNDFIAVKEETLQGFKEENSKQEVLNGLKSLSNNLYWYEGVKDDKSLFKFDKDGRLLGTINGTVLSVDVKEYTGDEAIIRATSWFGIKGSVHPKYKAVYKNGKWNLSVLGMAVS